MYNRDRNKANPFVREMPKYLRTGQISVHGYPADKSIFCNLKLGLLKLQEETAAAGMSHADIDQDDVSLAGSGLLQGSVDRAVRVRTGRRKS